MNTRLISFSLIIAALALAFPAVAQVKRQRSLPREPLEEYGMAPAPPLVPLVSPRMVVPMDGYTSYQINVNAQGLNIVGDAANEPSMTIDPTNPNNIAVGWRQFNSKSSNFRQGGYGYSTDGGLHWTFPGVLENNVFRSDPVLGTTNNGTFHYNSLQQTFYTDEFSSANKGQSWTKLGPATGGDKNWIAVDMTNSSGSGFVYQLWSTAGNNYGGRQFSRSTNGGSTWMNPINLPNQPIWGTMDVASNGDLYLCGVDQGTPTFWFLRSQNAKNAAQTPSFNLAKNVDLGGDITYGDPVNPDGLGGQCWIATDRSAGPTAGYIYMLCSVVRNASNPLDVMMIRSTDGGNTWSAPKRINDDAQNAGRKHWFGTLSVAPNGRVDVCWLDTRNSTGNTTSQLFYSYSTDGGQTFSANIAISPSFNQSLGYPQQNKLGDYMAMISDSGAANIVYPATFNGEEDIYFVRVPVGAQTVQPGSYSLFRGILVSGVLSDLFTVDGNYLVVRPGLTINPSEAPVQVVLTGTSPTATPSAFTFTLVAHSTSTNVQQQIELFNYQTNAYETLDTRQSTLADSTVTVTPSGDLSRFVLGSNKEIKAKVSYKATGPTPAPWNVSLNQTVWKVTP